MIATINTLSFPEGFPVSDEVLAVNTYLITVVCDEEVMERIIAWEERRAHRKVNGIRIAWGDSNIGERGGWEEVAILNSGGEIKIGTRTSRGWCGEDTRVYKLVYIEPTREAALLLMLQRYEHLKGVLAGDPLWSDIYRKYFGDRDNVPNEEDFIPIPSELIDAEGRAFLDEEEGTMLHQHPLYEKLFSGKLPEDIKLTIESTISQE